MRRKPLQHVLVVCRDRHAVALHPFRPKERHVRRAAAALPVSNSALYRAAASGGLTAASFWKYVRVVSLKRIGGSHAAIFSTAAARWTIALLRSGREPCPDGPRATSRAPLGCFSVVAMSA